MCCPSPSTPTIPHTHSIRNNIHHQHTHSHTHMHTHTHTCTHTYTQHTVYTGYISPAVPHIYRTHTRTHSIRYTSPTVRHTHTHARADTHIHTHTCYLVSFLQRREQVLKLCQLARLACYSRLAGGGVHGGLKGGGGGGGGPGGMRRCPCGAWSMDREWPPPTL